MAGVRFSDISPDLRSRAISYVGTLGLRTFVDGGEAKTGYKTLRNLTFDRGWWRDIERESRRFYMGFTPSPYDLPPDPATQWEVSQWVNNRIQHDADLFAIHMDGGIPWVEAYNDDFSLPEPPYSDSVKGTFLNYRNNIPPGHRLLVSINPLGIPRDLLAPYWGYGQGFDYDQDFNRIPNGLFSDDQNRMPPAPFDELDFDDPAVQVAFLNYARRVLQYFQPDYLLIGIEVSATLIEDPERYQKYLELHRFVYENLKADPAYSDVPILVSFSATTYMVDEYGVAYKYDEQEPGVRDRVVEEFERLLPYTDIVGLSLYPHYGKYNAYLTPGIIYDEVFELLERFGATGKPIGITESGYAADPYSLFGIPFAGNPEKQDRFYRLLFRELDRQPNPVEFVVSFQIRDGDIGWQRQWEGSQQNPPTVNPTFVEFYKYFRDIGIYDGDGTLRPSGDTWLRELALPRVAGVPEQNRVTAVTTGSSLTARFDLELTQRVSFHIDRPGAPAVLNGGFGITVDGVDLGSNVIAIEASDPVVKQDSFRTVGAHSQADVQYHELFLALYRDGPGDPMLPVEVRLYEDAMAYRYWIPGPGGREITGETSSWNLPSGSRLWYQTDTDTYEGLFQSGDIGDASGELGVPLTVELPSGEYLVLTEADLTRYSGMTLSAEASGARTLNAAFLDDFAWTVEGDSPTPWRVALLSPDLDSLVNSDVMTSLNEPPESILFPDGVDASWIRPGRALWSVWYDASSGFDLNVQKWYVERAAELGFEYVVVDAGWEIGFPAFGFADPFTALAELVTHGHRDGRNVDIIVWKPSSEIQDDFLRDFFFQKISDAGAAGVNIDFMLGESQQVNDFMERALRDAASYELVVTFGNVSKPTGLERTYPNAMSFEAVRGLEWNKLEEDLTPEHNAALPFTRLVAGPTTYRTVTFEPVELGDTTLAHQLATAGILHSSLQTWAANPLNLLNQPDALDVIQAMSGVWDETIVLSVSRIGKLVAMARRKGDRWFLFVLNGDSLDGRSIDNVDLSFLGDGRYRGVFLANAVPEAFMRIDIPEVDGTFDLDIDMLPGGGFVGMFTPLIP